MLEQKCPACHGLKIYRYFQLRKNGLQALKCRDCTHVFIQNSPITMENVADFYTMEDYKGQRKLQNDDWYVDYYHDCLADYESCADSSAVLKQFKEKIAYLNSQFPVKGRLLDVGCATGVFLDMARKQGWDVEGVEISSDLAAYGREKFSLKIHLIDLGKDDIGGQPFDAITLFDVIEHLPDIHSVLAACGRLLAPQGILLVRTPTEEGLLRDIGKMIYGLSFRRVELPMFWFYSFEHIQSFSLLSLRKALQQQDFSIIKVFREEESIDRVNIPPYVKAAIKGINGLSFLLNKQHKICVVARKC